MYPTMNMHRKERGIRLKQIGYPEKEKGIRLKLHGTNDNGLKLLYGSVIQPLLPYYILDYRRTLAFTNVVVNNICTS
jgi:hypothetical protein